MVVFKVLVPKIYIRIDMTDLFGAYTQMMLAKFALRDFTASIIFYTEKIINHWILQTVRQFAPY